MSSKCAHIHESGRPCKNWAVQGGVLCRAHGGEVSERPKAERCLYSKANGQPCQQWAVIGSNPPLCVAHAGLVGQPRGEKHPMWRHGFYEKLDPNQSLEAMIEDLFLRQERAANILEQIIDPHDLLRLLSMHFKNAAVIGKLLRDKQMLEGDDDLLSALGPALDLIKARLEHENAGS
jgi:hypothetical protein